MSQLFKTIFRISGLIVFTVGLFSFFLFNKVELLRANGFKQWEIIDLPSFTTTESHNWYDFPLQVTFKNGSTEITVDGYYDGESGDEQVWRVRFTPTHPGTWNWQSSSSDSQMDDIIGSIDAVGSTSSDINNNPNYRGHLKISPDNRYFTYNDDTPFFWLGDTNWLINSFRASLGSNQDGPFYTYLNDRESKGFTVIQIQYFSRSTRNEGGYVFPNNTGDSPGNGNFEVINPRFWQNVDVRMQALWDAGKVVAGHPSWFTELDISLEETENVSRYIMARYGAYNIVWSITGEYNVNGGVPPWMNDGVVNVDLLNTLANTVSSCNAYGHPMSIHPAGTRSSSADFHNQSWLDHNWIQTYTRVHEVPTTIKHDYELTPRKPIFHSEGQYENWSGFDAKGVRWQAYVSLLSGTLGHTYGSNGVWQFYDPDADPSGYDGRGALPWYEAILTTGADQMKYVADFFQEIEWWKLVPHREWLRVNGAEPKMPTNDDLSPPHAAANTGKIYIIFIPVGNNGKEIDITNLENKEYVVRRYNPRNGSYSDNNSITVSSGNWRIPSWMYEDNRDWVVTLIAVDSTSTLPQLLLHWLTSTFDQNGDGKVNGMDFGILLSLE